MICVIKYWRFYQVQTINWPCLMKHYNKGRSNFYDHIWQLPPLSTLSTRNNSIYALQYSPWLTPRNHDLSNYESHEPIPVAARSKAWVSGRSVAGISGSKSAGTWMSLSCECCVLSGRGLYVGMITRPEESYRVWCVWVWSWSLDNEEGLAHYGLLSHGKKIEVMNLRSSESSTE
jgi:hypothetical protein